jgi:hypothetical protein
MRRQRSRSTPTTLLMTAALAVQGFTAAIQAGDASEFGNPNPEFLAQKAALEKLVSDRDEDLYELNFQVMDLDEVILKDRLGREHVYNYLTFRLRNEIADVTRPKIAKPSRYNEVLKTIADQYEFAKKSDDGGGKLSVDTADGKDNVILERQDLKPRTRSVNITVVAYDEHGTRLRLLDEPIGSGTQETYNFPDYGELSRDDVYKRVREEVEEKVDRRLHTVDEIRGMKLPPYAAAKTDEEGVAEGEVFGVVLFNRLSLYGDRFTIEVRGLSNKFRIRNAGQAGLADAKEVKRGEVENYLASRVMRRVYVLHYSRPGDEFYRNLDRFSLEKGGWEWVNTFQRIRERKNVAYVRYFLNNLTDEKGVRQPEIEKSFWEYYGVVRSEEYPKAGDEKLPDLEKTLQQRATDK